MSTTQSDHTTFITGATGFIAFELIKNILEKERTGDLYLLVRANKQHTAAFRFRKLITELRGAYGVKKTINFEDRLHLVEGDITLTQFGLENIEYRHLTTIIDRIYHVAASVHLTGSLEKMMTTNVIGTQTVLDFALQAQNHHQLHLVSYVSTAYVAGKRSGIVFENELSKEQEFNNNYERAKYKSESLVQRYAKKLPIAIFRPSIVMGHSLTGWTRTFNVLYDPMKMVYFGNLKFAPADYKSIVDIVPVDYVAQGIYHISVQREKALSKTFHLAVGKGRSKSFPIVIKKIIASLFEWADHYKVENPKRTPILITPKLFRIFTKIFYVFSNSKQKNKLSKMLTYGAYVSITKEFDTRNAEALLHPLGIKCPVIEDYFDKLCQYAVKTHFGKSSKPEHVIAKQEKPAKLTRLKNVAAGS